MTTTPTALKPYTMLPYREEGLRLRRASIYSSMFTYFEPALAVYALMEDIKAGSSNLVDSTEYVVFFHEASIKEGRTEARGIAFCVINVAKYDRDSCLQVYIENLTFREAACVSYYKKAIIIDALTAWIHEILKTPEEYPSLVEFDFRFEKVVCVRPGDDRDIPRILTVKGFAITDDPKYMSGFPDTVFHAHQAYYTPELHSRAQEA